MNEPRTRRAGRCAERGTTLLEVLISLVIVAIGVLGLIGMQARAMSNQKDSTDRKSAAELLAQVTERMRANHLGFMANAYATTLLPGDVPATASPCVAGAPCTPAALAALDLANWQSAVRARLPDAGAVIAPVGAPGVAIGSGASAMRVTMIWREVLPSGGVDAGCSAVGVGNPGYRCLVAEVFP